MTTPETGTTTASALLAEVQADNLIGEARLPKLNGESDFENFLMNDAPDMDRYERCMAMALGLKAKKLSKAYEAIETLHMFFNDASPVIDARDQLDGMLLRQTEVEYGPLMRQLAYEQADLSSKYLKG